MGIKLLLAGLGLPFMAGGFALGGLGVAAAVVLPGPGTHGDSLGTLGPAQSAPIALAPQAMVGLYATAAAGSCPGLPWPVLAAIGTVESDNGESHSPGVHSGANYAGAEGPMQFEPATFAAYDRPVPLGGVDPPSPYDPVDAVWAAARLLCADGADSGRLAAAVFAYNHSATYVAEVLALAGKYAPASGWALPGSGPPRTDAASTK